MSAVVATTFRSPLLAFGFNPTATNHSIKLNTGTEPQQGVPHHNDMGTHQYPHLKAKAHFKSHTHVQAQKMQLKSLIDTPVGPCASFKCLARV